jgi:hypothetical protein
MGVVAVVRSGEAKSSPVPSRVGFLYLGGEDDAVLDKLWLCAEEC